MENVETAPLHLTLELEGLRILREARPKEVGPTQNWETMTCQILTTLDLLTHFVEGPT